MEQVQMLEEKREEERTEDDNICLRELIHPWLLVSIASGVFSSLLDTINSGAYSNDHD